MSEMSVASMRDRIEELEETVRQLRDIMRPKMQFTPDWCLTRQQAQVLALIYSRQLVPVAQCVEALGRQDNEGEGFDAANHVKVVVNHLRRKLRPVYIDFHTLYGQGYALDSENKTRVRAGIIAPEL